MKDNFTNIHNFSCIKITFKLTQAIIYEEVLNVLKKNLWHFVQCSGIVLLGGFISGFFTGIGSRIVMRIIALFFPHMASGIHLEGILLLLVMGIILSLGGSLFYLAFTHIKKFFLLQKPMCFGVFLLIFFGIPFFISNPGDELFGPQAPLAITLFTCLFVLSGYTLGVTVKWLDKKVNPLFAKISFFILIGPAIMGFYTLIESTIENLIKAIRLF